MGQGYELPDSTIQRGPLGRDLPLGLRLRLRHLAPSLRLDLDHLGRQRVDGLDDPSRGCRSKLFRLQPKRV